MQSLDKPSFCTSEILEVIALFTITVKTASGSGEPQVATTIQRNIVDVIIAEAIQRAGLCE